MFISACIGHDDEISLEVVNSWENGKCTIKGREVVFSPKIIMQAIFLPNEGI